MKFITYPRVISVLALFFVINVISIFEDFWWKDTYTSIYWSLIFITIVNLLSPQRKLWLRLTVDSFIVFFVTLRVTWHRQPEEVEWMIERLVVLQPIVVIVFAVALAMMVLDHYVKTKNQLMLVMLVGILMLTIKDSFSPLKLWHHVAWVLLIFLLWHSVLHFQSLNEKTRRYLLQKPTSLLVPLLAVVTIIMVIGISLPHGPPLLEDPYALWKRAQGEKVPAFIGDKGYGGRSNTPSYNTQSGFARDSSQLGGGFNFDYSTVMKVTTTHKGYLRGETKAVYDGDGWIDEDLDYPLSQITIDKSIEPVHEDGLAAYREVQQTITMVRTDPFHVMLSHGTPHIISNVIMSDRKELFPIDQGKLLSNYEWNAATDTIIRSEAQSNLNPYHYEISSKVLITDPSVLQHAPAQMNTGNINDRLYVEVSPTVPERVYELAKEVTASASNDYEKALLLEQHLRMNYSYTNTPDLSKLTGTSDDFVEQFLFELYEGYCDYFSTAMVIMARTLDMPARWVKGFTSGVNEDQQMLMNMPELAMEQMDFDTSGTYNIRNADAHSWVEIYFDSIGWVAFEPTPGFAIPQQYPDDIDEQWLSQLNLNEQLDEAEEEIVEDDTFIISLALRKVLIWSTIGLVIILFAILAFIRRQRIALLLNKLKEKSKNNNDRVIIEVNSLLRKGKRIGLVADPTMTMRETLNSWKESYPHLSEKLDEILELFEAAHYSKRQISHEQWILLKHNCSIIKKHWKKQK